MGTATLSKKEKKRLKDQKRRNKKANGENGDAENNGTEKDATEKKSKKRKAEDWNTLVEDEEAAIAKEVAAPANAWMKMVLNKKDKKEKKVTPTEEPPAKKKKIRIKRRSRLKHLKKK